MQVVRFIVILFTVTLLSYMAAHGQKVEVTQQFLDDATRAFREAVLLREAVAKQEAALAAQDRLIESQTDFIKALTRGVELRDEKIEKLVRLKCETTSFFWGVIKKKSCK